MTLRTALAVIALLGSFPPSGTAQDTASESALITAIKATVKKGFSYTIKPAANIPNFSKARLALAGATIQGEFSDGVFHARDGTYEIYRKGGRIAVKTDRGWLPLGQFTSPLRQDVSQVFQGGEGKLWRRGNVTEGMKALHKMIQLNHLVHRSDIRRLTNVGSAFSELHRIGERRLGDGMAELYEGYLNDMSAFNLLQGPFEEQVRRGNVAFQDVSGVGRVYIRDGIIRRIHAKAAAKYGFYNDEDNVKRRGLCTLEILADITRVGETKVEVPREVDLILDR